MPKLVSIALARKGTTVKVDTVFESRHTTSHNRSLGAWGENLAVSLLEAQGYRLIERNWRPSAEALAASGRPNPRGEIDAVMLAPEGELVFLEVKTRSSASSGHPLEAIVARKAQKLRQLAYSWLDSPSPVRFTALRIDAVAITGSPQAFCFEHLKAVA